MNSTIWTLITPAFIASVFSIAINLRADKIRARREYLTAVFESARKSIEEAVKAAAEYFPYDAANRTPDREAKIWLAERELRFVLTPITMGSASELTELGGLTVAFDDLIAALTGGSFQSASASADLKQLRLIAAAGAELRANLSQLRLGELRRAVDRDPISRFMAYWTTPVGGIK